MKYKVQFLFYFLAVSVLCLKVCAAFAKAPDTAKIVFAKSGAQKTRDIYLMNPDGSEKVNLTKHRADDISPVWSPTGEHILFASNREHKVRGTWDLYLMEPDGSNVRKVFDKWKKRSRPTWSPDGKRIAYDYGEIGNSSLYIGTIDGKEEERVAIGYSPAWSPDGTEIAYSVDQPFASQLTFINVQTRAQAQPLPKKALIWQYYPSWSAVGDRLAFTGNKHPLPPILDRDLHNAWKAKQTIYIVNRDGTGLQQLVKEAGPYAQYPALSPHGEEVLYTQKTNGDFQIFKLNLNSGVRTQLTHISWNTGGDWFDPAYALPVSPKPQLLTTTWGDVKKK
jgi:Tol biopolymer transport system component